MFLIISSHALPAGRLQRRPGSVELHVRRRCRGDPTQVRRRRPPDRGRNQTTRPTAPHVASVNHGLNARVCVL